MGNHYFKLNGQGIPRLKQMITNRVNYVKFKTAEQAYTYLLDFGYHAFLLSGPDGGVAGPGWTFYYAANWNFSVKNKNLSNITPERPPYPNTYALYSAELNAKKTSSVSGLLQQTSVRDSVFVLNSAWYGKHLNNGGVLYHVKYGYAHANNFIELCKLEMLGSVNQTISVASNKVY